MKKLLKLSVTSLVVILTIASLPSCKKNFDQPPAYEDPNIVANTSIKSLKAMHSSGGFEAITTDIIISGIVVADDKSGNFYKEMYIQDATGGMDIKLDATNLYTSYPIGSKVFIKCNGLYLSDYGGMIQLGVIDHSIPGNSTLAGIPSTLITNYLFKGSSNNPVAPKVVTLSQLTTNIQDTLLGTLIQLNDFQFATGDIAGIYADTSAAKNSVNLTLKNCSGNQIILRTSGYANFAGQHPVAGKGNIIAIYTQYNATKQLIIRDTSDVQFNGVRCNLFEQDFNGIGANSLTLTIPGWRNFNEVGSSLYQNAVFGSGPTKCAKITAFNAGGPTTTWLISPAISLAGVTTPKLSFYSSAGFISALTPQFKVYISTTYPGSGTPSTYFTTQLSASFATPPATGFSSFLYSGAINLTAYAGQTVYIGWRYDGNDPSGTASDATATYELDDVAVSRQ